jgi:hypothetical protein
MHGFHGSGCAYRHKNGGCNFAVIGGDYSHPGVAGSIGMRKPEIHEMLNMLCLKAAKLAIFC